jgi:adenylosuccinate synthase
MSFEGARPIYETLPGWNSCTNGITRFEDLPIQARDYIEFIEEVIQIPVVMISTGPETESVIENCYEAVECD